MTVVNSSILMLSIIIASIIVTFVACVFGCFLYNLGFKMCDWLGDVFDQKEEK